MLDTGSLLLGLVFSSIGLGYFIYGKKQSDMTTRYCGLGLMVYPYFIANTYLVLAIGVVLMLLPRYIDI